MVIDSNPSSSSSKGAGALLLLAALLLLLLLLLFFATGAGDDDEAIFAPRRGPFELGTNADDDVEVLVLELLGWRKAGSDDLLLLLLLLLSLWSGLDGVSVSHGKALLVGLTLLLMKLRSLSGALPVGRLRRSLLREEGVKMFRKKQRKWKRGVGKEKIK